MNDVDVKKGLEVMEIFTNKYGIENSKFIASRLKDVLHEYTKLELIELGEKIAFFNSWNDGGEIDDLMRINKK